MSREKMIKIVTLVENDLKISLEIWGEGVQLIRQGLAKPQVPRREIVDIKEAEWLCWTSEHLYKLQVSWNCR